MEVTLFGVRYPHGIGCVGLSLEPRTPGGTHADDYGTYSTPCVPVLRVVVPAGSEVVRREGEPLARLRWEGPDGPKLATAHDVFGFAAMGLHGFTLAGRGENGHEWPS